VVLPLWVVENRPFPLLWPLVYTTACTTVQAVMREDTAKSSSRHSNPDFQINPNSDPDVCRIVSKMWFHSVISPSAWKSAGDWETLINLLKSPIPQWWEKWKSDPESISGTGSAPKVNKLFRLVGSITTPSYFNHFRTRLQDCDNNPGKRRRIVKELLHTSDRDNTATDAENRDLCTTVFVFFLAKINTLKSSVAARLAGLRQSSKFPDPITPVFSVDRIPSVTSSEVLKLLSNFTDKSSPMDFVPTSLLKSCRSTFSELITTLANLSFSNGQFPAAFKSASVKPLLKKPGLDKYEPTNYRPISNINNISQIIERLFLNRFQQFVMQSPNFNRHQSAYRPKRSAETALLCIYPWQSFSFCR